MSELSEVIAEAMRREGYSIYHEYPREDVLDLEAADAVIAAIGQAGYVVLPPGVEATTFTINAVPGDVPQSYHWELTVEKRGPGSWAICRMRECLGADGEWRWESSPSGRSDEWLAKHRFDLSTALELAQREAPKVTVNGITVAEVLARHRPPVAAVVEPITQEGNA